MLIWLIYGKLRLVSWNSRGLTDSIVCGYTKSPQGGSKHCVVSKFYICNFDCALYLQDLRSRRLRQIQQEDGDADEPQGNNEDAERENWLKQIALASLKAADRLSSIQQVRTQLQQNLYPGSDQCKQAVLLSQSLSLISCTCDEGKGLSASGLCWSYNPPGI